MPAHDGVGRDDPDGAPPVWPQPRQQHPQEAVGAAKSRTPWRVALEDGELISEGEDLRLELEARPHGRPDGGQQGDEKRGHSAADRISLGQELQRPQQVPSFL
jgi:hypothetical protein